jgi:SAM-dependent methyltransferase
MADLKEADLFSTVEQQRNHWYYFGKIKMLRSIILKSLQSSNIKGQFCGLDFGAGNGVISRSLGTCFAGRGWHWDLVDSGYLREESRDFYSTYKSIPVGQFYDLILAIDVLEHIQDDKATLELLRAHLKPGGLLLVCVPAFQLLWSDHDVFLEHLRRYSRYRLLQCMHAAGLRPLNYQFFLVVLFPIAVLQRLLKPRTGKPESALKLLPVWLNSCLRGALAFERVLFRLFPVLSDLPGLSIIVIAESKF